MIGRRSFISGLVSLVAAPAIVRAGSLMPARIMIEPASEMIDDCFLRSLFEVLSRCPDMNATQVLELANEGSIFR